MSVPLPRQPGRKPAKRALETATADQVGLGQPHRAAASVCDSPCSAAPLCTKPWVLWLLAAAEPFSVDVACFKCALYIKDPVKQVQCPIVC